ncbi:Transposase, partial [Thalassobacillus cyri]
MSQYTPEEKLHIIKRYLNESISYRELENQVKVDNSVLRYWVALYRYHGNKAFSFPYTNYSPALKLKVIQLIKENA